MPLDDLGQVPFMLRSRGSAYFVGTAPSLYSSPPLLSLPHLFFFSRAYGLPANHWLDDLIRAILGAPHASRGAKHAFQ